MSNNFSFDATAGASQSTIKPRLKGNKIHDVKFDGCETQDIVGVKDPSQVYKVLKFKFSNDEGEHEHTVFEPRPADFSRVEKEITNKNNNIEKIPQASNVESMMLFFKHLIDGVNPKLAQEIDNGVKKLNAPSWDALREMMVKIGKNSIGAETSIKLINNNKGEAKFPSFFAGLTKPDADGKSKAYIKNNFIGSKLAFSPFEIDKIKKEESATPTPVDDFIPAPEVPSDNTLDLDFDI